MLRTSVAGPSGRVTSSSNGGGVRWSADTGRGPGGGRGSRGRGSTDGRGSTGGGRGWINDRDSTEGRGGAEGRGGTRGDQGWIDGSPVGRGSTEGRGNTGGERGWVASQPPRAALDAAEPVPFARAQRGVGAGTALLRASVAGPSGRVTSSSSSDGGGARWGADTGRGPGRGRSGRGRGSTDGRGSTGGDQGWINGSVVGRGSTEGRGSTGGERGWIASQPPRAGLDAAEPAPLVRAQHGVGGGTALLRTSVAGPSGRVTSSSSSDGGGARWGAGKERGAGRAGGGRGGRLGGRGGARGRAQGGGRTHRGAPAGADGDECDPGKARDLPSLAALVQQGAAGWSKSGNVSRICAAFNRAGKLSSSPTDDHAELLMDTLDTLAAAYLPLVPGLWNPKFCVMPLWACAKAGYWHGGLVEALLQQLGRDGGALMRQGNDQSHGNVWWSLSVAPEQVVTAPQTEDLLRASTASLLQTHAADIGPQECSNVLLACARLARLRPSPTALLHHLTACLPARRDAPDGQHLSNGLYALGELRDDCGHVPRPQDLQRLAEAVAERMPGGGGFAAEEGRDRRFIAQELSNMLLGCCKLGYDDPALLRPLAAELQQRLAALPGGFTTQALSNSLYALGVLGCVGPEYAPAVAALAAECHARRCAGFKPQELANTVWALAKLGRHGEQDLFAAAVAEASQPGVVGKLTAQSYANLWYGLALARHFPPPAFLLSTAAASEELRTQAKGQECVNLLWSLATLAAPYNPRLVEALVARLGELRQQKGELSAQALISTLWALAVMGPGALARHRPVVAGLVQEVVRRWNEGEALLVGGGVVEDPIVHAGFVQLWQVQQELAHEEGCAELADSLAAAGCAPHGSLLGSLRRAAAEGPEAGAPDPITSRLQHNVVRALERLQRRLAAAGPGGQQAGGGACPIVSISGEQQVEGQVGRLDVLLELAEGQRVALEVDGPAHFMANSPHRRSPDGPTRLRDRQLERVFGEGNVLSVPYWEWMELRGDEPRQEAYLLRLLGLQAGGR